MTIARAQMNRQLYQMGGMGIESLSPMQPAMQPAMQSAMYNPLEENYYSGMPMMMAGGGIQQLDQIRSIYLELLLFPHGFMHHGRLSTRNPSNSIRNSNLNVEYSVTEFTNI